jgi:PAS domain S-box-containing protein
VVMMQNKDRIHLADHNRKDSESIRARDEWALTFDAVPDLIMILDRRFRIVRVNKAMADRMGRSPEELEGLSCYEVAHGTEGPLEACPHAHLLTDGVGHEAEVHDPRLPGDFLVTVSPLRDSEGNVTGSVHVAHAITKRKRMEDALREGEKKYRQLIELAQEGIWTIDENADTNFVNPRMAEMLGYSVDEMMGRSLFFYMDERGKKIARLNIERRKKGIKEQHDFEFICKNGNRIYTSLATTPLIDERGQYKGSLAVVADITDRKQAEGALKRARDELEQRVLERTGDLLTSNEQLVEEVEERKRMERALRQSEKRLRLLSSQLLTIQEKERKRVAQELHDGIGQMLTAIKFKVENTLHHKGKGKNKVVESSLKDVVRMIQLSVEEARRIQMDLRPSILDDLGILATIGWFCREFQKVYTALHIEMEIDVQENEVPPPLKTVIYRVLQEALNNVAKHSNATLVRFSLKRNGERIELLIGDNGAGFAAEEVLTTEGFKKGFGLSGMRERTELSNGTFRVDSRKGSGTTIKSSWPVS